jgi:hypothetical protein
MEGDPVIEQELDDIDQVKFYIEKPKIIEG